jgi:hypothetical protein
MFALVCFVLAVMASPFRSKGWLVAENMALQHQLNVRRRKVRGRVPLTNNDRWFYVQLYRRFLSILQVLTVVRPETLVHWHRVGFRRYWRWKSRSRGGGPKIEADLRVLIRRMSVESALGSTAHPRRTAFRSRNRPSPNTWRGVGEGGRKPGRLSSATTRQTSPPWTCSSCRPLASNFSMAS